jgi:hypothetical protein
MRTFLLFLMLLCQACQQYNTYMIEGQWQLDSSLHYYNHFQYSEVGDKQIIYHYTADTLVIFKANEKKEIRYEIDRDTLKWLEPNSKQTISDFQIISLQPNSMILREALKPLYSQPNQFRYRQYYYSRVD